MLFHFRGRPEQGVATAARLFGAAAVLSGQRANAWVPDARSFDDSVSAFAKLDKEEFFERGPANPALADYTVLFELSLLEPKQLREGSVLIVNSAEKPSNAQLKKRKVRVLAIDALEHVAKGKRIFANMVLLGFLSSQFKKVQLKSLKQAVDMEFSGMPEKQHELEAGSRARPLVR